MTAGNYILRNVKRLMREFGLRKSGNYTLEMLRPLLDHYKLQLRIFSKVQPPSLLFMILSPNFVQKYFELQCGVL